MRRATNTITQIKNGEGEIIIEEDKIQEEAIRSFSTLFTKSIKENDEIETKTNKILNHIPQLIINHDNLLLVKPFSLEEVKNVVFSMHSDKATGPDGFPVVFFQKCWHFMGSNIWKVVEESTKHGNVLK